MYKRFLVFTFIFILFSCAPAKTSYFGEETWVGVNLSGQEVVLKDLPVTEIALNVYSPDCVPCFKEIPSLNLLTEEIQSRFSGKKALFLVVDPKQILPDAKEGLDFAAYLPQAKERMLKEIRDRNIKTTVLFMKPPFQVGSGSLVTGTPETILLETKPLRIYYNFIGSISEKVSPPDILNDSKYQFFRHQFGLDSL